MQNVKIKNQNDNVKLKIKNTKFRDMKMGHFEF